MLTIEKSIVIDAPVERVFAYIADPSHLPEYYTDVDEVRDIRHLPNGGYAGRLMPLDLTVETTELVPGERIVSCGIWCGSLADVTITTTFDRLEGDKTRVTCREEHTFHGGFFGRIGEKSSAKYFERSMEMTQTALKAHVEAAIPAETAAR